MDVRSQRPKPRFAVFSILSKAIAVVSQTIKASIGLKKHIVTTQDECPICVGSASDKFLTSMNRGSAQIVQQVKQTIRLCSQRELKK